MGCFISKCQQKAAEAKFDIPMKVIYGFNTIKALKSKK